MNLKGTGVALVTPFNFSHEIDENALAQLVHHCVAGGVDFLVVLGTTGEGSTLTSAEKTRVRAVIEEANSGRLPLILGVGGNCTADVAEAASKVDPSVYEAILSVSPYYNKPTQEGIYRHFMAVADRSSVPVVLYNVPGRTASNMQAETTLRLASDHQNIVAIKEASGQMEQIMQILADRPEGFLVWSGDDALTVPMLHMGADGVISVMGQAYPQIFSSAVKAGLEGRQKEANALHNEMLAMIHLLFLEGNPAGVKSSLAHQSIGTDRVRLPLVPVSEGLSERILKEHNRLHKLTKG
jgi:4-hydroxy-tetrahydrodipicolinate synthase